MVATPNPKVPLFRVTTGTSPMQGKLYKCCALVLSLAAVESLSPPCGSRVDMEDSAKAVASAVCADTTTGERTD